MSLYSSYKALNRFLLGMCWREVVQQWTQQSPLFSAMGFSTHIAWASAEDSLWHFTSRSGARSLHWTPEKQRLRPQIPTCMRAIHLHLSEVSFSWSKGKWPHRPVEIICPNCSYRNQRIFQREKPLPIPVLQLPFHQQLTRVALSKVETNVFR